MPLLKLIAVVTAIMMSVTPALAQQSTRVAFGCCMDHSERQDVFDALNFADPEVFVLLGNTVDVDADDMDDLLEAYDVLNRFRGPKVLRRQSAVMSVWNRTDYAIDGQAGVNNPLKYAVRNHFLTFWREPISSPRMFQQHGIAKAVVFGEAPQRVQVILLDGRWNRDPLAQVGLVERMKRALDSEQGPYLPNRAAALLGDEQWQWLAEQLQEPAEVRVLMSATPFFAPPNGFDSWSMYGSEQQRLVELLQQLKPNGLVLAVGDRGFGELAKIDDVLGYPLWQVTSGHLSSATQSPYRFAQRQGRAYEQTRYGQIEVSWQETAPELILSLRDVDGRALIEQRVSLTE